MGWSGTRTLSLQKSQKWPPFFNGQFPGPGPFPHNCRVHSPLFLWVVCGFPPPPPTLPTLPPQTLPPPSGGSLLRFRQAAAASKSTSVAAASRPSDCSSWSSARRRRGPHADFGAPPPDRWLFGRRPPPLGILGGRQNPLSYFGGFPHLPHKNQVQLPSHFKPTKGWLIQRFFDPVLKLNFKTLVGIANGLEWDERALAAHACSKSESAMQAQFTCLWQGDPLPTFAYWVSFLRVPLFL